jgi:NitT/TauT family transport system ATP-binding protein
MSALATASVEARSPSAPPAGSIGCACAGLSVALPAAGGMRTILRDVDLVVAPGEIVTIVGGSGTGKTTLLRTLGGLVAPAAGTVTMGGEDVRRPPAEAVTVFQDYANALLPWRTVRRNVALGLEARRDRPAAERARRVEAALAAVGLAERADDRPWQLSGGMQQRVQLARALALDPKVLLMDEPFGALDAMTKAALQDELLSLHARTRATIVFITHDIEEALYLGDRVVLLGGQPGRVCTEIRVDLPRPRDQLATKELPAFLALRHRAYQAVQEWSHAR